MVGGTQCLSFLRFHLFTFSHNQPNEDAPMEQPGADALHAGAGEIEIPNIVGQEYHMIGLLTDRQRLGVRVPAMNDDTAALARAAAAGDADALSTLLARIGPMVERSLHISPIWQTVLEPSDVMQISYLEAFLQIRRYDPARGASFQTWLQRIAENNLRDAIRGLQRQKQLQPADRIQPSSMEDSLAGLYNLLEADSATPSRNLRKQEASQRLQRTVDALPPRYRDVVRLYDLEGQSIEEVARRIGRSAGAIHMLRARAHDRLRELMAMQSMSA